MASNTDKRLGDDNESNKDTYVTPQLRPSVIEGGASSCRGMESLPTACLPAASAAAPRTCQRRARLRRGSEGDAATLHAGHPMGSHSCLFGASTTSGGQEAPAEVPRARIFH